MATKSQAEFRPLNPGESKALKALVFDLSESGAKQALYGLVQVLCSKPTVSKGMFEEVIDDAVKYCDTKRRI